ncbi:MAG: SH3 domain-containing protein [Methyloceanibacter sp.]|uniref:SH3 domain-containing protein n=1 Tax=Methyloceanibacter sp. TaxID=1965321 RepID=UPI003D6D873E
MNRLLLSLWLAGAAIYGVITLVGAYAIIGWPSGKSEMGVVEAEPKGSGASTAQRPGKAPDRVTSKTRLTTQGTVDRYRAALPDEDDAAAPPLPPGVAFLDRSSLAEGVGATRGTAVPAQQSAGEWARVSRKGANVRSGPSSRAPRLATFKPRAEVRVLSREGKWMKVTDGSETGWIYQKLLKPIAPPSTASVPSDGAAATGMGERQLIDGERVTVSVPAAIVRASPSEGAPLLFAFPAGRQARIIARRPGWVQVADAGSGAVGWIDESTIVPGETTDQDQETVADTPQQRAAQAEDRPRGWNKRRGGRMAGILRRALGAF